MQLIGHHRARRASSSLGRQSQKQTVPCAPANPSACPALYDRSLMYGREERGETKGNNRYRCAKALRSACCLFVQRRIQAGQNSTATNAARCQPSTSPRLCWLKWRIKTTHQTCASSNVEMASWQRSSPGVLLQIPTDWHWLNMRAARQAL